VAAVASLHKAGVLHRDIKPSNILVTAEERLVLLDVGLAAELGGAEAYLSSDSGLVDTVAYMSPEQGSVDAVTQASDWYSVGAVLYEALTGRVPFSGGPLDVLFEQRQRAPPPPSALVAPVPEDLIVLYAASQFSRCIEKCQQAIDLLDRTGDFWEVNMARYQVAASFYRLGDLQRAQEEAQKMYHSGLELGDVQASALAVDILSKAGCGKLPREMIQAELDRPRGTDAQTTSQILQAEGVRLLAEDDFRAAAAVFRQGWEIARRAGTKNTYAIPCLPWLATALRREAERIRQTDPAQSRRLLQQAQQAAIHGRRLARKFRNDLPPCLRELGLISSALGRDRAARQFFHESLAVAVELDARDEHEQASRASAELDAKRHAQPAGPDCS